MFHSAVLPLIVFECFLHYVVDGARLEILFVWLCDIWAGLSHTALILRSPQIGVFHELLLMHTRVCNIWAGLGIQYINIEITISQCILWTYCYLSVLLRFLINETIPCGHNSSYEIHNEMKPCSYWSTFFDKLKIYLHQDEYK